MARAVRFTRGGAGLMPEPRLGFKMPDQVIPDGQINYCLVCQSKGRLSSSTATFE